jgi:hypothetical protein
LTSVILGISILSNLIVSNLQAQADPLSALLATAQKQNEKQPTDAIVTFAIFANELQDTKAMDQLLAQTLEAQIKAFLVHYETLAPKKKMDQKSLSRLIRLSYLKVDQDLPINLEALTASADQLAPQISQAKSVIFLRYQGRKLKKQQQLHLMCQIAMQLGKDKVISNLSTFESMDLPTFQSRCTDFNQGWHRPGVELIDDQHLRLISRGLSQFASPEVESNPLTKDQAAQSFVDFQKDLMGVIKLGSKKILATKQYQNRPFSACQRSELSFENQCIQLTYPLQK